MMLTRCDMSTQGARDDARAVLNRAIDRQDTTTLAMWAREYGISALDYADKYDPDASSPDEVASLERELEDAQGEAEDCNAMIESALKIIETSALTDADQLKEIRTVLTA